MEEIKEGKGAGKKAAGWRVWLYRFIAGIFIPALLILGLEVGLRLAGFGFDAKAIIRCKIQGQKAYCDNLKFGWLFFPPNIARPFTPFVIPAKKSANTYRIFVFGSSAAQGVPDGAYSFSRILEVMLSERYPGVNFEVINTAMTAINSHVVVRIAEECARYEPDLFVVYMGNNEVIGPYGAGTVFAPLSGNLSFIRFGIALRGTRTGQLLINVSQAFGVGKIPKVWHGMELFVSKEVSSDDKKLQIVYENYRRNLETIVNTARKRKASVILATVGSNLKDCPPFGSLHRGGITESDKNTFERIYKEAMDIDKDGRYAQALERYLSAEKIDGRFAELQFCIGRCYFQMGQYEEARRRFINARELDVIRFRADDRINAIIRETAQKTGSSGVYLADAAAALEKESPYKIPGDELFYEHVHLTFRGNYILAKTVYEQIEKVLPGRIQSLKSSGKSVVDEDKCMRSLVYSDWDKCMILQSLVESYITIPPFTNQINNKEQVENFKQQINSLANTLNEQVLLKAASDYQKSIEARPSDWMLHWKYGNFLMEGLKDYRAAEGEFNKVLELVPQYYMTHSMLGTVWERLDNCDEAIREFKEAIKIKPSDTHCYYEMGLLYEKKGMISEAERSYRSALRCNPEHFRSYINLGALLAKDGRIDEAIRVCRRGLEFLPNSDNLHYNLGCIFRHIGRREEAIKEFRAALEINPGHSLAKQGLETLLTENDNTN